MNYADAQIKKFTDSLKLLPDFKNTIVVFIADHGKTNFVNNNRYTDGYYHIPTLFWGGALVDSIKGTQIDKIGSQVDIVKTLLNQINVNTEQFNWSKDLLNPTTKEWAVITTSYSYGIKTPKGTVIYQFIDDVIVFDTFKNPKTSKQWLKKCQAVIESVFREYQNL
jgi:phosphoglycerol transferase MdoB-like AlkP superfamily enzyme